MGANPKRLIKVIIIEYSGEVAIVKKKNKAIAIISIANNMYKSFLIKIVSPFA